MGRHSTRRNKQPSARERFRRELQSASAKQKKVNHTKDFDSRVYVGSPDDFDTEKDLKWTTPRLDSTSTALLNQLHDHGVSASGLAEIENDSEDTSLVLSRDKEGRKVYGTVKKSS